MNKILICIPILLWLIYSCSSGENNTECNECEGGLLDGFLYKEVTLEDIANLTEINVTMNIGQCIRFRMDGSEFSEATVVADCCCTVYE